MKFMRDKSVGVGGCLLNLWIDYCGWTGVVRRLVCIELFEWVREWWCLEVIVWMYLRMEWVWKIVLWDVGMVSCFEDDGNGRVYFVEEEKWHGCLFDDIWDCNIEVVVKQHLPRFCDGRESTVCLIDYFVCYCWRGKQSVFVTMSLSFVVFIKFFSSHKSDFDIVVGGLKWNNKIETRDWE